MLPSVALEEIIVTPRAEAKFTLWDVDTGLFTGCSLASGFVADGVL
jgi:hypothetical protein